MTELFKAGGRPATLEDILDAAKAYGVVLFMSTEVIAKENDLKEEDVLPHLQRIQRAAEHSTAEESISTAASSALSGVERSKDGIKVRFDLLKPRLKALLEPLAANLDADVLPSDDDEPGFLILGKNAEIEVFMVEDDENPERGNFRFVQMVHSIPGLKDRVSLIPDHLSEKCWANFDDEGAWEEKLETISLFITALTLRLNADGLLNIEASMSGSIPDMDTIGGVSPVLKVDGIDP